MTPINVSKWSTLPSPKARKLTSDDISVTEFNASDSIVAASGFYCEHHPSKRVEAFCDNCNTPLCINCILTNMHKGHDIINIEQAQAKILKKAGNEFESNLVPYKS